MSPQVLEKLKKEGIDPDNFTLKQLWPEVLDEDGNDLSLMSGAEWEIMITYAKTRKYLLEKYPQSQEEAKMLGQEWDEEPEEPYQINIAKARDDPKEGLFVQALLQMKVIYDKVRCLAEASYRIRENLPAPLLASNLELESCAKHRAFRAYNHDSDIFEMVDAYFKICRKYHVPTFEEPYYFLSEQKRRDSQSWKAIC